MKSGSILLIISVVVLLVFVSWFRCAGFSFGRSFVFADTCMAVFRQTLSAILCVSFARHKLCAVIVCRDGDFS